MNKYFLTNKEVDKFSEDVVIYIKNMITKKHHATNIDFENGLCFDKHLRVWKPPYFDFYDLASAIIYGAELMQITLIDREKPYSIKHNIEKEENVKKQHKRKNFTYGANKIMENIVSKYMGKETLTIDEVAEVLEELFGA